MLALESKRWLELTTFVGKPADSPRRISEWLAAIGTDKEKQVYRDKVFDSFLHQSTITNLAFAVVPWIVQVVDNGKAIGERAERNADYLIDVALVEMNRLSCGVHFTREGTEPIPQWLMPDYHFSIDTALHIVPGILRLTLSDDVRRWLTKLEPGLRRDSELAWKNWVDLVEGGP
jgi:hypothetical protein